MNYQQIQAHLKLHIEHQFPNLEDCYSEGYENSLNSIGEEQNPYTPGTTEHQQYSDGWWAGFYGEEPLYGTSSVAIEQTEAANAPTRIQAKAAIDSIKAKASSWKQAITYRVFALGAAAIVAIMGYQLVDLAFI